MPTTIDFNYNVPFHSRQKIAKSLKSGIYELLTANCEKNERNIKLEELKQKTEKAEVKWNFD